jgi:hypothetical protein
VEEEWHIGGWTVVDAVHGGAAIEGRDNHGAVPVPATIGGKPVTVLNCGGKFSLLNLPDTIEAIYSSPGGVGGYQYHWSGGSVLKLPKNIKYIGDGAFMDAGLTSLLFPAASKKAAGRIYIDRFAFSGNKFFHLDIPGSVKVVGYSAFEWKAPQSPPLKSLSLEEGIVEIAGGAFTRGAYSSIVIPKSVRVIGNCAFADSVTQVEFKGNDFKLDSRRMGTIDDELHRLHEVGYNPFDNELTKNKGRSIKTVILPRRMDGDTVKALFGEAIYDAYTAAGRAAGRYK